MATLPTFPSRALAFAGAAAVLVSAPGAQADSYYHGIDYTYSFVGGPTRTGPFGPHPLSLEPQSVRSSGPLDRSYTQALRQAGPADTSGGVSMRAFVDFGTRRFGTNVFASARTNAFDPARPPTNAAFYDVQGRIEAIVSDDVRIYSPSVPLGYLVTFSIAPGRLDGQLSVPESDKGSGVASVSLGFSLLGFQREGTQIPGTLDRLNARSFEKILATGDPGPKDLKLGAAVAPNTTPAGVAQSTFTVFNGETYTFDLRLASAVQMVPWGFPAEAPPLGVSASTFDSTYYYNGLTDFRDGDGNPLPDLSFVSVAGSGFDWVSQESSGPIAVVPVPASAALLAGGLALLAGSSLRRRAGDRSAAAS